MPRRGTLIAYLQRDDSVSGFPTVLIPASWERHIGERVAGVTCAAVWPLGVSGASVIGGELRNHADVFFHAYTLVIHATLPRALFVLTGHPYVLAQLADRIASDALPWTRTWADLPALRASADPVATSSLSSWPTEHIVGGVRRLMVRIASFTDDDAEGGAT